MELWSISDVGVKGQKSGVFFFEVGNFDKPKDLKTRTLNKYNSVGNA